MIHQLNDASRAVNYFLYKALIIGGSSFLREDINLITLKDKEKEDILYIDETKEKPIHKIISRQKAQLVLSIIILILLLLSSGFAIYFQIVERQIGLVALVDSTYIPDEIPTPDPGALPLPPDISTEDMNEKLDAGKMCINMVSRVSFSSTYSSGRFGIINSEANNFPQFITITENNTGAIIYQTGLINPGECILYDTLDVVLAKGLHDCTATFIQVDLVAKKVCGKAAAKVTIEILN